MNSDVKNSSKKNTNTQNTKQEKNKTKPVAKKSTQPKQKSVKIFGLGGFGENGKNMYCVEVDNKIIILDSGIKYPSVELYGVDSVMPDMEYIKRNKNRVVGCILTHGHEDHIGAISELVKIINIKVYGTTFTMALVEDRLEESNVPKNKWNLQIINPSDVLNLEGIKVSFFSTTHSIPESIAVAIHTSQGVVVYTGDYSINNSRGDKYSTDYKNIIALKEKGVLALMGDSLGAEKIDDPSKDTRLDYLIDKIMYKSTDRLIITTFSTDLIKIQNVINKAIAHNKKIAIIGRKTQKIVNVAVKHGYLSIPNDSLVNLKFLSEDNNNLKKNLVVLVTGVRHEPFFMIQRMVRKVDRLIHLNNRDTVLFLTPPVPGTEKISSRTLDMLYRKNIDTVNINRNFLRGNHADLEGIQLLYKMLNPKHIIPVIGEYRHQYAQANIARNFGYTKDTVHCMENGEVLEFTNKVAKLSKKDVPVGDLLVDGLIVGDINEVVINDRVKLSEDGVFLIVANVDSRKWKVVSGPTIESRGFIYMKNSEDILEKVHEIFDEISNEFLNPQDGQVNWNDYRNELRDKISKYLNYETKRRPIVLVMLVDVHNTNSTRI